MAHRTIHSTRLLLLALGGLALTTAACREGSGQGSSSFNAIPPPDAGTNGCHGSNQVFTPPQVPTEVDLTLLAIGPMSQIAADKDEEITYVTGVGATVVHVDFQVSAGAPPVETSLVGPGVVDALLATAGILTPAELSGIAIVDDDWLIVVEHTSNTLLLVDRNTPDTVDFYAGLPSEQPGFSDGVATQVRFSFSEPTQLAVSGDGRVFVADTGNHAVRMVFPGAMPTVVTAAGTGAPGYEDGNLWDCVLDSPVGLSIGCNGTLLVTEAGFARLGGHRLRSLAIGDFTFFGLTGTASTLAGDGTDATVEGIGELASLAGPVSLASTSEGELYWLDSSTGILRRHDTGTGATDCPLFADCATAVGSAANFTMGGRFSLAVTQGDVLLVVDADAGSLLRVTPPL
jgi:hypothetical protein